MSIRHRILSNLTELVAAIVIAALIVVVPAPLLAQQNAATPKAAAKAVAQVEEEAVPTSKKPGDEGIKVHGHWVIDVKDKDGKVVEHRDFQNALQAAQGSALLVELLLGQVTMDQLYVLLTTTDKGYWLSGTTSLAAASCTSTSNVYCSTGLTQAISQNNQSVTSLILTGQFQAAAAMSVTGVSTNTLTCLTRSGQTSMIMTSMVPASSCKAGYQTQTSSSAPYNDLYSFYFTSKDLSAAPLVVAAGQTVSVTVTISFS